MMSKAAIHHVHSNSPCCFEGVYTWTLSCNPTHENANSDNALHLHNLNSDQNCKSNISYSHTVWSNASTWLSLLICMHILEYLQMNIPSQLGDLKYIPLHCAVMKGKIITEVSYCLKMPKCYCSHNF